MTAALILGAAVVGGLVVWIVIDWRVVAAEREMQLARAIRDEAARILDCSERHEAAARALLTPTAAHQVIAPPLLSRVGQAVSEWLANVGPDTSADWQPGEIKALTERPPLRPKASKPARARDWLLPKASHKPTPAVMARLPYDPTRQYRVTKVRCP